MRKIIEFITHCDRWHRLFLEYLRRALVSLNVSDLNALQALLLYHLGHQSLRVTQIAMGDVCLGSNPSYNLKKMHTFGYLQSKVVERDRRALLITLSPKGLALHKALQHLFDQQMQTLLSQGVNLSPIHEFMNYGKILESILIAPVMLSDTENLLPKALSYQK